MGSRAQTRPQGAQSSLAQVKKVGFFLGTLIFGTQNLGVQGATGNPNPARQVPAVCLAVINGATARSQHKAHVSVPEELCTLREIKG